jgi:Gpi18-like mannosyltransferase
VAACRRLGVFPGYPAAIDALRWLPGLTVSGAGLVVTLIAGFAAAWGIMSLGTELTGEPRVGLILAALWAVAPGSITLQMTYAEALFCALAAWALVALARRQWLTAGLLTCLSGTVRSTAVALVAAVIVAAVVQLIRSRADWWRPVAAVLLAPLGLAGYWIFVAWATRHAPGWFWVERNFWVQPNQSHTPFDGVKDTWHEIKTAPNSRSRW